MCMTCKNLATCHPVGGGSGDGHGAKAAAAAEKRIDMSVACCFQVYIISPEQENPPTALYLGRRQSVLFGCKTIGSSGIEDLPSNNCGVVHGRGQGEFLLSVPVCI